MFHAGTRADLHQLASYACRNTVLDDNKKLCLMSGEMISMSTPQSMIFEVQDLAVASPATVSRCGMVYVEPSQIGWEPMLTSWLATLPEALAPQSEKLTQLCGWLIPPCLRFVKKDCKSTLTVGIQSTDEITRVRGLFKLFDSLIVSLRSAEAAAAVTKELPLWVENLFVRPSNLTSSQPLELDYSPYHNYSHVYDLMLTPTVSTFAQLFCLVWSVAGVVDEASRPKFDAFLRSMCSGKPPRGYEKVILSFCSRVLLDRDLSAPPICVCLQCG